MRSVTLTPTRKPDGHASPLRQASGGDGHVPPIRIASSGADTPVPFAKRKGTRASEASSQGMPVQDPSERSTYPANVFPSRRAEEATAPAREAIEQ